MLLLPPFHTRSATEVNEQADQVQSVHVSGAAQES